MYHYIRELEYPEYIYQLSSTSMHVYNIRLFHLCRPMCLLYMYVPKSYIP